MRCDKCGGKGRVWGMTLFGQGEERTEFPEIGPCPDCGGCGEVSCCEGASREEVMVEVAGLIEGSVEVNFEVNPNEAS